MFRVAYAPIYKYRLPPGHRFPMEKYDLLVEQLLYEGTIETSNLFEPDRLSDQELLLTHTASYLRELTEQRLDYKAVRKIGFPMSPELVERGRYIAGGTYQCIGHAQQSGIAFNIAGGTHHSYAGHGEGFCLFNDVAVAANLALHRREAQRIFIVDLDVHQGNGTAHIFRREDRVFTFSMHGGNNYPVRKERSDFDVELPDKTGDSDYLGLLQKLLPEAIDEFRPDLLFFVAGADVLESDKLGRLSLTLDGCKQRDRFVLQTARQRGIPLVVTMGGGYSKDIKVILEAHANTYRMGREIFD